MLADPQSVTIDGNAISLPRTSVGNGVADYKSADGVTSLRVMQSDSKTARRTSVVLRTNKIAADPLTAINSRLVSTVSVNFTAPVDGFTPTELAKQLAGLATLLTASSNAVAIRVLGGEK